MTLGHRVSPGSPATPPSQAPLALPTLPRDLPGVSLAVRWGCGFGGAKPQRCRLRHVTSRARVPARLVAAGADLGHRAEVAPSRCLGRADSSACANRVSRRFSVSAPRSLQMPPRGRRVRRSCPVGRRAWLRWGGAGVSAAGSRTSPSVAPWTPPPCGTQHPARPLSRTTRAASLEVSSQGWDPSGSAAVPTAAGGQA